MSTDDFRHVKPNFSRFKKLIYTEVDLIAEEGDKTKMFQGILSQYTLSVKDATLETIFLTEAKRWDEKKHDFVSIPGDCLTIPYEKVTSLNLRLLFITRDFSRLKKYYENLIIVLLLTWLLVIFIYPWFLVVPFLKKLFAIIFLLIGWSTSATIINQPLEQKPKRQKWSTLVVLIVFAAIMILHALNLLNIVNTFDIITLSKPKNI